MEYFYRIVWVVIVTLIIYLVITKDDAGMEKVYKENVRHGVMYKSHGKYYWCNEFRLVGIDKVEILTNK